MNHYQNPSMKKVFSLSLSLYSCKIYITLQSSSPNPPKAFIFTWMNEAAKGLLNDEICCSPDLRNHSHMLQVCNVRYSNSKLVRKL